MKQHDHTIVNLLPMRAKLEHQARLATRLWGGVLGVAVPVALGLVLVGQFGSGGETDALRMQIEAIDLEIESRTVKQAPVEISVAKHSESGRDSTPEEWADMLRALALLAGEQIGFSKLEIGIDPTSRTIIEVQGRAEDSHHVLAFASKVEQTGLFMPMNSPEITPDQAFAGVRFTLGVQIDAVAAADGGRE